MVMTTIFCDCEGMFLIDFKETNTTVNGKYYIGLLHKLRENILHDNVPVHIAGVTQVAILDFGFHQIDRPPYSPDMTSSDYYLFGY
jgi:hypothetical protein